MTAIRRIDGLEVWGGVECTVNRVGDRYFDQLARNGHAERMADLDLFAWLGITALRYPVLWERTARQGMTRADWSWSDARLARLRELAIRPILGLVHHGSGPPGTSLLDDAFPEKLAAYARAVAERYPWVDDWTPVNEPMTTARFSALYGLWYPHGSDMGRCIRALLNQCRAIVLAMRAIRDVNPRARLVQTEDIGRVQSTPQLAYQADYENVRRLLSLDLLTGRVTPGHPLWRHLLALGASTTELAAFMDEPIRLDVVGLNYYVTSDRFLDHRLDRYPAHTHGGNGRERYADVEAARVADAGIVGHGTLVDELWARYRLPLAITEVHLGCTREEQLRWLHEAWGAAAERRASGVDVRAVTAWSLLGAFDWDSLLVRSDSHYESGAFDLRAAVPRATALAYFVRGIARDGAFEHPALGGAGWWRRAQRVTYPSPNVPREETMAENGALLLVTGATGTLGKAFERIAALRGLSCRLLSRRDMDIADADAVRTRLERDRPWALINAAGYVRVDDAENDRERCWRENVVGAEVLAQACRARDVALVTFSSDLVFNGRTRRAYPESEAPDPLGVYGASKAAAERTVAGILPTALVIRTAAFFGPWDEYNFVWHTLRTLREGRTMRAAEDLIISPTYVPDLVHATLDLLVDGEQGLWHLANEGAVSWVDLARGAATRANLDASLVEGCSAVDLGFVARRPAFSVLGSERGQLLRPFSEALDAYMNHHPTPREPGRRECPTG